MKPKSKHKKSLSDNFNVSHESMKDLESQFLSKILMSIEPPQDFLKLITPVTNSSQSNFDESMRFPQIVAANNSVLSSISSLNMFANSGHPLPQQHSISTMNNTSIPNLNKDYIPYSYQLSVERKLSPDRPLSSNRKLAKGKFFFGEDFSNEDSSNNMISLMSTNNNNNTNSKNEFPLDSPLYYINSPPPGLTPTKIVYQYAQSPPKIYQDSSNCPVLKISSKRPIIKEEQSSGISNSGSSNNSSFAPSLMGGYYSNVNIKANPSVPTFTNKNMIGNQGNATAKVKPVILSESSDKRFTGKLKFFDEGKNYGFLVMDEDGSDIFVHYDDLSLAKISKEHLRAVKNGLVMRFSFSCMQYIGKYDRSRKAIDLELIEFSHPSEAFMSFNRSSGFMLSQQGK